MDGGGSNGVIMMDGRMEGGWREERSNKWMEVGKEMDGWMEERSSRWIYGGKE